MGRPIHVYYSDYKRIQNKTNKIMIGELVDWDKGVYTYTSSGIASKWIGQRYIPLTGLINKKGVKFNK